MFTYKTDKDGLNDKGQTCCEGFQPQVQYVGYFQTLHQLPRQRQLNFWRLLPRNMV